MHGAVLLDEQARVVRPALIWCDVRTEKQSRDLTAQIGAARLIQLTCNPALTNFTLTKCLWVRENGARELEHTRAHVIRAILEGVAFSLRDTFTIFKEIEVPVKTIRLGGGGARSTLWRQIQADIYGQRVETVEAEEGAAYGAAILAGVGAKAWPSVDAACDAVVRVAGNTTPNSADSLAMEKAYAVYRRIYPAMKSILN